MTSVAGDLLKAFRLAKELEHVRDQKESEKVPGQLEQWGKFQNRYCEKHKAELESGGQRGAYERMQKNLEDLAQRCSTKGTSNAADTETL